MLQGAQCALRGVWVNKQALVAKHLPTHVPETVVLAGGSCGACVQRAAAGHGGRHHYPRHPQAQPQGHGYGGVCAPSLAETAVVPLVAGGDGALKLATVGWMRVLFPSGERRVEDDRHWAAGGGGVGMGWWCGSVVWVGSVRWGGVGWMCVGGEERRGYVLRLKKAYSTFA